jgi:ABC-2 type transport system ATP-binding protein
MRPHLAASVIFNLRVETTANIKAIDAQGIAKYYGDFLAVDHINFAVEQREIFGFLGPNGAGKTTTIKMLTGVSIPSEGRASIFGYDIVRQSVTAKSLMGIVPDTSNIYDEISAWSNLIFTAKLYGVPNARREERARELLTRFGLYDRRNDKVSGFSSGMRRRVCIAMALMNESKLLFLDEPTVGLDVESHIVIHELMRSLNEEGLTIFLTTHNIEEASQLCDRVAIINRGKIVAIDTPESLKRAMKGVQSIEVAFRRETPGLQAKLERLRFVKVVQKHGDKIRLLTDDPPRVLKELWRLIQNNKLDPITMNTIGPSLEEVFLELTGKSMEAEVIHKKESR